MYHHWRRVARMRPRALGNHPSHADSHFPCFARLRSLGDPMAIRTRYGLYLRVASDEIGYRHKHNLGTWFVQGDDDR